MWRRLVAVDGPPSRSGEAPHLLALAVHVPGANGVLALRRCAGVSPGTDEFSTVERSCISTGRVPGPGEEQHVVIVAGHLVVDPVQRESYLAGCASVVEQARRAPGCLDFSIAADLVVPGRVNVFERWESHADVEAFRGSGPSDEQSAAMLSAAVWEYDVAGAWSLT